MNMDTSKQTPMPVFLGKENIETQNTILKLCT